MLRFLIRYFPLIVFNLSFSQIKVLEHDSLYTYTNNLVKENQHETALKICLNKVNDSTINDSNKAQWLILTGDIFSDKQENVKALNYYYKSLKINQRNKDSLALMQDFIKIGIQHNINFNKFRNSDSDLSKSFKDSSLFYYKKNINEFKNVSNGKIFEAQSHNNLSFIYSKNKKLKLAENHIDEAIKIYSRLNSKTEADRSLINKGLIYIYQNKFDQAKEINLKILNKKKDTSNVENLINLELASGNLAFIYKETNEHEKAFDFLQEYMNYTELIYEKQKASEIRTIEAKYNVDKARQEEQLNTLKEEKAHERTILWSGIGGITSLGIILFGSILYRNSKLKAKNLSLNLVQQELNKQQELKQLQIQNQSKVLSATLDGREKERKDIAQTLHDSVSALLSSVSMHIQVAKKKTTTEIEELDKSHRILGEASDKVRDLSHQLLSAVLVKFGLAYAVDDMCEKYSNSELTLELEADEVIPRFEVDLEVKLKNIIEEFINNIIKHSKASKAIVSLDYQDENLSIDITDNGIGFDTAIISPKSGGVGLSQIKARVESLGGNISIESTPNKGTTININIPAKRRQNA